MSLSCLCYLPPPLLLAVSNKEGWESSVFVPLFSGTVPLASLTLAATETVAVVSYWNSNTQQAAWETYC